MAHRLNDLVVCGELFNTRYFTVRGWLGLRGREQPVLLQLAGNCDPDLMGWHIRFEAREIPHDVPQLVEPTTEEEAERIYATLVWQQVGAAGNMTAARKVKTANCSIEELMMRCKADEPPPFEWKPCLYLEWFSQNGRVVVELVDPIIEDVEHTDIGGASAEDEVQAEEAGPRVPGLGITAIHVHEDGEAEVQEHFIPSGEGEERRDDSADDPYDLLPAERQRQFDADARSTDRALRGEEDDAVMRETELMDELIESGPRRPLETFVELGKPLPDPDEVDALDDEQVETELLVLLGHLALFGIALDLCEHATPRDALSLLVAKILPEECGYPELRDTQWVQHYATSDYCEQCAAEGEP